MSSGVKLCKAEKSLKKFIEKKRKSSSRDVDRQMSMSLFDMAGLAQNASDAFRVKKDKPRAVRYRNLAMVLSKAAFRIEGLPVGKIRMESF